MSAIAFDIPDEIHALCDGLGDFLKAEVMSRHEKHHKLLSNGRYTYDETAVIRKR